VTRNKVAVGYNRLFNKGLMMMIRVSSSHVTTRPYVFFFWLNVWLPVRRLASGNVFFRVNWLISLQAWWYLYW
jgi:hypothetical protein